MRCASGWEVGSGGAAAAAARRSVGATKVSRPPSAPPQTRDVQAARGGIADRGNDTAQRGMAQQGRTLMALARVSGRLNEVCRRRNSCRAAGSCCSGLPLAPSAGALATSAPPAVPGAPLPAELATDGTGSACCAAGGGMAGRGGTPAGPPMAGRSSPNRPAGVGQGGRA